MEMTKRLKLIVAAMAAVTVLFSVQATPVTAEQAARAARSWIRGGRSLDRRRCREVESAEAVTAANGAAFHVVKVKDGGFVVMSADTTIEPVIAFSSSGELRNDPRNPLWTLLTGDLAARAKARSAKLLSAATSSSAKSVVLTGPEARWAELLGESGDGQGRVLLSASTGETTLSDVRVDALVKSAWSQEDYRNFGATGESNYCYNYYTPGHWPCGCVATAGAQIMRYHCYPTGEVTPASYSCATGVLMKVDDDIYYEGVPVTLAMQGGFYDWNSMTLVPANGCTAAARRAIGKLTSDIGISCGMKYYPSSSSAPVYMLVKRLVERFQYANAVGATFASGFYSKDFPYTLERFKTAVIPNFDAGLPVAIGISGGGYGHAVVGDGYGYSDGSFYVHINLGWANMDGGNAWYMPPDIDEYDTIDTVVYNVYPTGAAGASLVSGRVLSPSGSAVEGAKVTATASGGTSIVTTSDASGFYALMAPAGTYGIVATKGGGREELTSVTVGACVSTVYNEDGTYSSAKVPQIGNVYGLDFTLDSDVPGPVPADPMDEAVGGPGLKWTTGADYPWTIADDWYATGEGCLKSDGTVTNKYGASSWLKTTVSGPVDLGFRYAKTLAGASFTVECDGTVLYEDTDSAWCTDWILQRVSVPAGSHEIVFRFTSKGGYYNDFNGIWLDEVGLDKFSGAPTISPSTTVSEETATTFTGSMQVVMNAAAGATILYTDDGSEPNEDSKVYSGPITLTKTTYLRAVAIEPGREMGPVVSALYIAKNPIEPGEWTTDVDGVLAAAKTNGNLIAVMYANLATCGYCQQLDPLAESAEFTSWAKEKGIYLVTADQSRYPYAAKALSWFYSYHTGMTYWPTIVFFNAWEPDVGIGEGLFRYGETVNGLTYQSTITSLKECFASFLSDRPVQPVQQSFFRFDGNGADSGSMADVVIDVSNDFPLNRFVRYGYSFLGWSNDPNDTEPLWADGEWPDVMLFDPGETVHTIYAVWEPELDYPEIFHFDGNGADSGEMQTFVANGEDFPLNSFVRHGYVFLGWALEASAKEPLWADGEMPEAWMFEPATNEHVLYAVWAVRKLSAVTASNAFIDGSVESPTYDKSGNVTKCKVYTGEYISFYPDEAKGWFQSWTVKPATILDQLGEEIRLDSYLEFPMPAEAVTVTANMVAAAKCGAQVFFDFVGSDTNAWSETAGAAWSPDKGKTWIPAEFSYPLAAGTYTIKFRAPEGWVAPGDLTLVVGKPKSFVDEYYDEELKKTVKETRYEPAWIERSALFYPVSETKLTTVKFDGNGGKPETAQVSYPTEYLVSGLRPLPSVQPRSGYAFDGWWTAKDGGEEIVEDEPFDPMKLDPKTKALYAHWKKTYTVTLGGANMEAYAYEESDYWRYDSDWVQGKGAKLTAVGNGQFVNVSAPDDIVDAKSGKKLAFQKWTVSPSSAVLSGDGYDVQSSSVTFLMPESDLTLTPTYVDAEKCGRLCAYAWSQPICLGWDEEAQDYRYLEADYRDMQWSPDGGKTWYCCWDSALLPAGTYTVQWRSASPMWQAPTTKMKVEVVAGVDSDECCYDNFSFVPVVVIDVETSDGEASEGCSVALNPKDGRVLPGKTLALTAKDSKTYIFQNWEIRQPGSGVAWYYAFEKSFKLYGTTKKSVDGLLVDALWDCIDPEDFKIHVTARFKSVKDYTQEDLLENFNGVYGPVSPQWEQVDDRTVEMTIYGMAGCSLDYMIEMGFEVNPITFKNASGKLPKGVKFDAKAGVISGVPTAKGVEKTTCVLTVTDPAKNVLNVKVNFEIRPFEAGYAGEYNALLHPYASYWDEEGAYIREEGKPIGQLQMSVTSAGKVSAKILHQGGSTSLSGNLTWYPDDGNAAAPGSFGIDLYDKSKGSLWGTFNEDGTMSFDWEASYKDGQDTLWLWGEGDTARRQDLDLYKDSPFANKYYTFSFGTSNTTYGVDCAVCDNEGAVEGGYGYLTVKTDAKGVAKIAGQLPDGTAVSGNAAVMPYESASGGIRARLYFFNAPSAYKKNGWCAMSLELVPDEGDGVIIFSPDETYPAAWFEPDHYGWPNDWNIPTESGIGAFYSPAQTLENHYWAAVCAADDRVDYEFEYKEGSDSWTTFASPMTFGDTFFAVELAGDKKGSVALAEKSPAPWKDRGEWNYREDKKGNPITDPSQLSISFAKATGVFSGKSNIYFDYYDGKKVQHQAVSVPYAGVMVNLSDVDPELGMMGLGAAVYSNKRTESDCSSGKTKKITYTQKVSLPVVLAPID